MRKYNVNENYFECINSHEKAYVLGFFYADGCNHGEEIRFTQDIERIDILQNIKQSLNAENPIKECRPGHFQLSICSKKMSNDLIKLGCPPAKSLILHFPTSDIVPTKYLSSFILGYFDGDGCVWNSKRRKMIVKDSSRKEGFRERIVHNVKFTFTGCISFIDPLQDYLVSIGVVNKKTKLNNSKVKNTATENLICTMEYSGRKQLKNLYEFMFSVLVY